MSVRCGMMDPQGGRDQACLQTAHPPRDERAVAATLAQPERGGSSRLAALLCPAAAGKGHAAVGCEASDARVAIGCADDSA